MQWRGVRRLSVCKLLRKSLLLADKWPDRHETCTRWTPGQGVLKVKVKVKVKGHVIRALSWILGMSYSVIDGLVIFCFRPLSETALCYLTYLDVAFDGNDDKADLGGVFCQESRSSAVDHDTVDIVANGTAAVLVRLGHLGSFIPNSLVEDWGKNSSCTSKWLNQHNS